MAESNEKSSCSNPPKRSRMDCLIPCSEDDSKLIMSQDFKSWTTLLNAAKIRNNAPVLETAKLAGWKGPRGVLPSEMSPDFHNEEGS